MTLPAAKIPDPPLLSLNAFVDDPWHILNGIIIGVGVSHLAIYELLGRALETNHQIKIPMKISKARTKDDPILSTYKMCAAEWYIL